MSNRRMIVLAVATVLGLAVGYYGNILMIGVRGSLGAMTSACRVLQIAEQSGIITAAQRGDIVDEFVKTIEKDGKSPSATRQEGSRMLAQGMKGDCKLVNLSGS